MEMDVCSVWKGLWQGMENVRRIVEMESILMQLTIDASRVGRIVLNARMAKRVRFVSKGTIQVDYSYLSYLL